MKILLFLSALFIFGITFSKDKKTLYQKFKERMFYATYQNESGKQDTLIIRRHDNVQTKSFLNKSEEKVLLKLKVIWISDSKYNESY